MRGHPLGKNVRSYRRPSGIVSVYWVWPPEAKRKRFKTKIVLLVRDFENATQDEINSALQKAAQLNRDVYEHIALTPTKRATSPRKPKQLVDHATLLRFLTYDTETGEFYWNESPNEHISVGDVAGFLHPITGYIIVGLLGKTYLAHRLAWFYVYGVWPENHVDHIDRNRSNNRIVNLRDVTPAENMANAKGPSAYAPDPWRRSSALRKAERTKAEQGMPNPMPDQFTKEERLN